MKQNIIWVAWVLCICFFITGCSPENASPTAIQTVDSDDEDAIIFSSTPSAHSASTQSSAQYPKLPTPSPSATPADSPKASGTPAAAPVSSPGYGTIRKVNNETGYVKGRDVRLRTGPGTEYDIVRECNINTKLVITGKTNDWYRVKVGGDVGFILKELVGVGVIPTPTPTPKPAKKTSGSSKDSSSSGSANSGSSSSGSEETIEQGELGNYPEADIYLAAKLIYAEGKSQSTESFLAMANVLYNRCNSKRFGGTVEKEVYRSGQFSVVKYDSFPSLMPSAKALGAAKAVFNEGKRVLPAGVLYFRSASKGKDWSSSRTFYKKIGGNNYYY